MKKRILALLFCLAFAVTMFASCTASEEPATTEEPATDATEATDDAASGEPMTLNISGLVAGLQTFPIYVAQQNGYFAENNLEVEIVYFENGPVQMESILSGAWDVAATGIGGVLVGAIAYDAQVIAAAETDDGTQMIFVRPDSAIVAAGQGNNTVNEGIYGDAESWKGATVLGPAGTSMQYCLVKTLEGFGLTLDDVEFMSTEVSTGNSAFLSGEGDAVLLSGVPSFTEDKADYVVASSGNMAQTGIDCNLLATEEAVETKQEEIKIFLDSYFRASEWIKENQEESIDLMVEFAEVSGSSLTPEIAEIYIQAEYFYTLEDNYEMFNELAEGSESVIMEQRFLDILEFFISVGNYQEGDDERFKGHLNNTFINELYEAQ